jgi:hypothetical protein
VVAGRAVAWRSAERQKVVAHRPQPAAPIAAAHALKKVLTQNSSDRLWITGSGGELVARLLDRRLDGLVIETGAGNHEPTGAEVDVDVLHAADLSHFLTD